MTVQDRPGVPVLPAVGRTDRAATWAAAVCALLLALLTVAVALGLTRGFDAAVLGWARPGDVWGPVQWRAGAVTSGLRPVRMLELGSALVLLACLVRRSLGPALLAAAAGVLSGSLTLVLKLLLARPDPHGALFGDGGSFPSGHTVTAAVAVGVAVMVCRPSGRRLRWLLPGLVAALIGVCLVLQGAHWATDVLGGALIAAFVLLLLGPRSNRTKQRQSNTW